MTLHDTRLKVNRLAYMELDKAIAKHGLQPQLSLPQQYLILMEEVGEISNAIQENDLENCKIEIAQSISMLIKLYWLIENMEEL